MVLRKVTNPNTHLKEWALLSKTNKHVLQYFGKKKPEPDQIKAVEKRVQFFKNIRKRHIRQLPNGQVTMVKTHKVKRPKKIGSSWKGPKFKHGPRKVSPKKFDRYYTTPPDKDGVRKVMGRLSSTGQWVQQSTLTPNKSENIPSFEDTRAHRYHTDSDEQAITWVYRQENPVFQASRKIKYGTLKSKRNKEINLLSVPLR